MNFEKPLAALEYVIHGGKVFMGTIIDLTHTIFIHMCERVGRKQFCSALISFV